LAAGDSFSIRSKSGNEYAATFLAQGPAAAGIYVRLDTGALGRLEPGRLEWSTLSKQLKTDAAVYGDEVVVAQKDGTVKKGTLAETISDKIVLISPTGSQTALPLVHLNLKTFRVAFRSKRLYPGEEFTVQSLSGREYRGVTEDFSNDSIRASLVGMANVVSLRRDHLDAGSMRVLVPIRLNLFDCSPVA
jgi:hypothetical protein